MPRKTRGSRQGRRDSINTELNSSSLTSGSSMTVRQWDDVLNAGTEDINDNSDNRINFGLGMTASDIERYEALLNRFGSRTDRSLEIAQVQ